MNIQNAYITKLVEGGKRSDGRAIDQFRDVQIDQHYIEKAEGSVRVRIGKTEVIAGVKMEVGQPFPDKPDEGVLMVGAELMPMASPTYEQGPPKEDAIELARVVDRGIRESGSIDVKKLCIEPEVACWKVMVDIIIVNFDGNLIDACGVAAIAALRGAYMPEYNNGVVNNETKTTDNVPLIDTPIPVTSWKIGNSLIIDPTQEEEEASSARLTVTTKENGNICAMQKGGSEALTQEEIEQAMNISIKKGAEIRNLLK